MTNDRHRREYAARDTRQGDIILRTRRRKIIFIAGLAGFVVLSLFVSWFG